MKIICGCFGIDEIYQIAPRVGFVGGMDAFPTSWVDWADRVGGVYCAPGLGVFVEAVVCVRRFDCLKLGNF